MLYSYCLRYDDGAAPNPYWGVCTLAICKPAIRRTAKKGDWVVGLGSKRSPIGNISGCVVYAMKLSTIMTMEEYDDYCRKSLRQKMPAWGSADFRRKVGDCIYDYSRLGRPTVRHSVHTEINRKTDLGGLNVLLSKRFYYFGDKPVKLPHGLMPIVHQAQGHKSLANEQYCEEFVRWIEGMRHMRNTLLGEPQLKSKIISMNKEDCRSLCSRQDREEDEQDRLC